MHSLLNAVLAFTVMLKQMNDTLPLGPAAPDYGFVSLVLHAGMVEKLVMGVLGLFSVLSWAIIIYKWRSLRNAYQTSTTFLESFWKAQRLDLIYQKSELYLLSPVAQVFRAGYVELSKLKHRRESGSKSGADALKAAGEDTDLGALESIERSMRRSAATELTQLESLVSFLATTGSTAPFIGLLGTVVGIMNSFQEIGTMGNANLATVAPGIGGALVATAFGLFAAIPAVIAYNMFLSKIRVLSTEMDNFASDFLNIVKRHFF